MPAIYLASVSTTSRLHPSNQYLFTSNARISPNNSRLGCEKLRLRGSFNVIEPNFAYLLFFHQQNQKIAGRSLDGWTSWSAWSRTSKLKITSACDLFTRADSIFITTQLQRNKMENFRLSWTILERSGALRRGGLDSSAPAAPAAPERSKPRTYFADARR